MSSTLWIGTTGLTASEKQMDVIGNNLANANTVGFKAADTYFASMLSQSISSGTGSERVGQGVGVAAVSTIFSQGSFESTGNATDVAIDGNGFFVLKDKEGASLYTRAGGFHVSKEGMLSDMNNYTVQGHMFSNDGTVESQSLTDLNLRDVQSKPRASTTFNMGLTLDSQTQPGDTFDASQVLYDSRGAKHSLSTTFTKTEESGYWGLKNLLDDENATSQTYSGIVFDADGIVNKVYQSSMENLTVTSSGGGTATAEINSYGQMYKSTDPAAPIILTRNGTDDDWLINGNGGYENLTWAFNNNGALPVLALNFDGAGTDDITFTLDGTWGSGDTIQFGVVQAETDPVDIKIRFYEEGSLMDDGATIGDNGVLEWNLVGDDAPNIKSYATTSRISSLFSDGYAPGTLTSVDIDKSGLVEGVFSNGQRQNLARILLADFPNIQGLNKIGSYFTETAASGAAVDNNPGSGGLGELQSHSLEVSNTDVAKEFIKMITAQRAYQSSARIITTADQMLQELMSIKR